MKLIPCCEPFGELLADAGHKGMAVVPCLRDARRLFYLQARPFDPEVVVSLSAIDPTTGSHRWPSLEKIAGRVVPFVTVMTLPLKHCPACGASLEALAEQNTTAFDEAAHANAHLWET